jgi:hypothetical protein
MAACEGDSFLAWTQDAALAEDHQRIVADRADVRRQHLVRQVPQLVRRDLRSAISALPPL